MQKVRVSQSDESLYEGMLWGFTRANALANCGEVGEGTGQMTYTHLSYSPKPIGMRRSILKTEDRTIYCTGVCLLIAQASSAPQS